MNKKGLGWIAWIVIVIIIILILKYGFKLF